jgi:hypothetical protein
MVLVANSMAIVDLQKDGEIAGETEDRAGAAGVPRGGKFPTCLTKPAPPSFRPGLELLETREAPTDVLGIVAGLGLLESALNPLTADVTQQSASSGLIWSDGASADTSPVGQTSPSAGDAEEPPTHT